MSDPDEGLFRSNEDSFFKIGRSMKLQDSYQAFMMDYAAGNLGPSMMLAGSLHRLMSSQGDEAAVLWETVRNVLRETGNIRPASGHNDQTVGEALDIIHTDYSGLNWRQGLSGVKYAKLPSRKGQLMRLEPGRDVFSHGHSALEATVVLEGSLSDGLGIYHQGEILLAEPGLRHKPAAYGNDACTCFVARSPKPFWRLT